MAPIARAGPDGVEEGGDRNCVDGVRGNWVAVLGEEDEGCDGD